MSGKYLRSSLVVHLVLTSNQHWEAVNTRSKFCHAYSWIIPVSCLTLICTYMWPDLRKGVLYMHPIFQLWRGITSLVSKLLGWNVLSYKYNDRKVLLRTFKAVDPIQAELHILKIKKLDACIRPLFANLVTYK